MDATRKIKRRAARGVLGAVGVAAAGLPVALGATAVHAADTDIRVTEVSSRASSTALGDDWIELTNMGASAVDLTGWRVDDDSNSFASAGIVNGVTSIAPGESVVLVTEADGNAPAAFRNAWFGASAPAGLQVGWLAGSGLGLGSGGDAINVFNAAQTRVANVTFGSGGSATPAPTFDNSNGANGAIPALSQVGVNGAFVSANNAEVGSPGLADDGGTTPPETTTTTTTPPTGPAFSPFPGSQTVRPIEDFSFGEDMSGLDYEASGTAAPGVIWVARNKAGTMFRLLFDGTNWMPDTANGWGNGKDLRYPGGVGHPDSEGISYAATSAAGGMYIASERDNDNSGVSRNSVLRYDVTVGTTPELVATQEWNLTADLPATGANLGLEAITWIGDAQLTAQGFYDESKGHAYDPAEYPNHGTGVFFVALEATGGIYAYVLNDDGSFTRVATIASDLTIVTDLQYDPDMQQLWAECDNTCNGRLTVLEVSPSTGKFAVTGHYERPTGLADNNNEGFAIAPNALCVDGFKPVYWADDGETGGVSIVEGGLSCDDGGPDPVVPEFPLPVLGALSTGLLLGGWFMLRRRWDQRPA